MIFRFEPSMITFKKVKISNLSFSLGGTLTILDEDRSTPGHDVYKRYSIPLALARVFKERHKISRFLIPVEGCIMLYQGNVVAIEKAAFNERTYEDTNGEIHEWVPMMESVFNKLKLMTYVGNWYFDGSYVYSFKGHADKPDDIYQAIINGKSLSGDEKFKSVEVDAIRLTYAGYTAELYAETRQCLAYLASPAHYSVSPPVWKQMSGLGNSNLKRKGSSDELVGLTAQFDKIDHALAINLNFALTAGNILTKEFGYKSIEPLQLPKLMTQLKTVNLPRIAQETKQTFDIGLTFTQTVAWLLGMQRFVTKYDQMLALRKLFKYISVKGIYAKSSLVQIQNNNQITVPMLTKEQAAENVKDVKSPLESLQAILDEARERVTAQ